MVQRKKERVKVGQAMERDVGESARYKGRRIKRFREIKRCGSNNNERRQDQGIQRGADAGRGEMSK
jgi:hypothetical protein